MDLARRGVCFGAELRFGGARWLEEGTQGRGDVGLSAVTPLRALRGLQDGTEGGGGRQCCQII